MKFLSLSQRTEFKNSDTCTVIEYSFDDANINIALIKLSGRYPEKGYALNQISKEIAYVMKGEGRIVVEDKLTDIKEGDSILIEPNEKFYWEGNMTLCISCVPAWKSEQYKFVD